MRREPVLVVFGSKRGGTAEIAQWIGDALGAAGVSAEVRPAAEVRSIDGYSAALIGGALYTGRWHGDARRFARRFRSRLRELPVWLFCSGPLDDSAKTPNPEKVLGVKAVAATAEKLNAREVGVFGGKLDRDARGLLASAMAKNQAGDYRDRQQITTWAMKVAAELAEISRQP